MSIMIDLLPFLAPIGVWVGRCVGNAIADAAFGPTK